MVNERTRRAGLMAAVMGLLVTQGVAWGGQPDQGFFY